MNGSRGAKGSINDLIISFLYRKRYLEYLKKKESYTKEERQKAAEYLKKLQKFDIETDMSMLDIEDKKILEEAFSTFSLENISTFKDKTESLDYIEQKASNIEESTAISTSDLAELIKMSNSIIDSHYAPESYDFSEYDYYDAIMQTTAVGDMQDDEVIDIEEEVEKKTEERIILEEVDNFIDESKKLLYDIKFELRTIKGSISEQHTQEDINHLNERYLKLKEKLDELKKCYSIMKEKYEFEDYEALDNLTLIENIEDYKTKAGLEELEGLVDACKTEVEAINGIVIEEEKSVGIGEEIEQKKVQIKRRDDDFSIAKGKTIYLDSLEKSIQEESENQRQILIEIEKKVAKVEHEIVTTTEYIHHTGRLFASFLRVATGILTAPFSNNRFLGVMLGTHLINRGLRDLRTSLIPEEIQRTEVRQRYQSVEREILKTKDEVSTTLYLIDDSLLQIESLKDDFKVKFEPYSLYIPEYRKVEGMLNDLEKKMNEKKKQIKEMQENLDKQYSINQQKVLKASSSS